MPAAISWWKWGRLRGWWVEKDQKEITENASRGCILNSKTVSNLFYFFYLLMFCKNMNNLFIFINLFFKITKKWLKRKEKPIESFYLKSIEKNNTSELCCQGQTWEIKAACSNMLLEYGGHNRNTRKMWTPTFTGLWSFSMEPRPSKWGLEDRYKTGTGLQGCWASSKPHQIGSMRVGTADRVVGQGPLTTFSILWLPRPSDHMRDGSVGKPADVVTSPPQVKMPIMKGSIPHFRSKGW